MLDAETKSKGLLIVGEEVCAEVVSSTDAFTAVEAVFGAMAKGDAYNFPVIREAIGYADALYGFKSGFDKAGKTLGVKSGGYWPGNMANMPIPNSITPVASFSFRRLLSPASVLANHVTPAT